MGFNYAISDSANFHLKNNETKQIELYTKYANSTTAEFTSEQVYALAKGSRAVRFDYNKQGTLNVSLQCFDLKWISILLGGTWNKGAESIAQRDVLIADATNQITLTASPETGSLVIYKLAEDNIGHLEEQTEGDPTNENEYSIAGDVITLNTTTAPEGAKFVAYYLKDSDVTAETIHIKTDEYPVSYEIFGKTMLKRKDNNTIEYIKFRCPNAIPQGQMTFTMEAGGVTTVEANFDLFGDSNDDMMVITKI